MAMTPSGDPFYLHLITSRRSARTAANYLDELRVFQRWCYRRETDPEAASKEAVQAFLADELLRVARNTVAHRLAALRAFYAFLGRPEVMDGIQIRQTKLAPRKPLSPSEVESLLKACRNERDRAMITVAAECGLRVSELVGISKEDVNLAEGLLLVEGKGSKQRWVGLSRKALVAIAPFVNAASHQVWLTRDGRPLNAKRAKRNMEEIERRAQVKAHWHRLRTTFAHRFLEATHDIDSLQTLMGHADTNTTRRYAAYGAQQRALDQMRRYSEPLL